MNIIERIEKIAEALKAAKEVGATRIEASIDDVEHSDLLAACDHYGVVPGDNKWYMTPVNIGEVRVVLFGKERKQGYVPPPSAIDMLRAEVKNINTAA